MGEVPDDGPPPLAMELGIVLFKIYAHFWVLEKPIRKQILWETEAIVRAGLFQTDKKQHRALAYIRKRHHAIEELFRSTDL